MNRFLRGFRCRSEVARATRFLLVGLGCVFLLALAVAAQQPASPSENPPPTNAPSAEFLQAADEVLAEMSKLLALPVKSPLKKSLRTREEIRDYVVRRMKEDKQPAKRYADQKALEKFGLVPKGFEVEPFLIELLTEQIAGLYDPKAQEFFIADWIPLADQRMVMAHELTHALQDQHFQVQAWVDAAKPNDDAELARGSVLEGCALAAMLDYVLRGQSISVRELPDLTQFARSQMLGELNKSPQLSKAPRYLRDALLFPYLAGTGFTQRVLRANTGWGDFHKVFENPPASTQQILHPDLYLKGVAPERLTLPDFSGILPADWKKLDENIIGEFGLHQVLEEFLDEKRATQLSAAWAGDRYAIFERKNMVLLVYRLHFSSTADAARFFGSYSEALELKYQKRSDLFRRPNFFSFQTDEGGVFLRCFAEQCFVAEGADRQLFDRMARALGWPAGPAVPAAPRQPRKVAVAARVPLTTVQDGRWVPLE